MFVSLSEGFKPEETGSEERVSHLSMTRGGNVCAHNPTDSHRDLVTGGDQIMLLSSSVVLLLNRFDRLK